MRRALSGLSLVIIVSGVLLLVDAGLTVVWQEPVSALYARHQQDRLESELRVAEGTGPTLADRQALRRLRTLKRRMGFLARRMRRELGEGDAVGRIRIPRIKKSFVVVEGTDPADLRQGPGRYADSSLPGLSGTTALAGHRTTYLAPFREIDKLREGNRVELEMPYGRFVYNVFATRIVKPTALGVLRTVPGERRLVLTACHPLYSAKQRIVVMARLVSSQARGAARQVSSQARSVELKT
jgi:sortase A